MRIRLRLQVRLKVAALSHVLHASCADCRHHMRWLDGEGAGLIRTLRKSWGDETPKNAIPLLQMLAEMGQPTGTEHSAAALRCAQGVVHLLPAVIT